MAIKIQAPMVKIGEYSVFLSNRGNPDHGENPNRPKCDAPRDKYVVAKSIKEASELCSKYIQENELGGGNWTGGNISNAHGIIVGRVAYNGRVFDTQGNLISI